MLKFKILKSIIIILIAFTTIFLISKNVYNSLSKPTFSQNTKAKHLVVISVDALNAQDFNTIKDLPNFKQILDNGSYAKEVVGVYPSLTYPSHTSIITGTYPDKHGIYNNELSQPGIQKQQWFWYRKDIKAEPLYDSAKKSNMKTASIFWPVTGGANIDYNCSEIWTTKKNENQIIKSLSNGSPLFLLDINKNFGKMLNGTKQPNLDNFAASSAAYVIKSKKPNLTLLHLTETDHIRHKYGTMSQEAKDSLIEQDKRIGLIIQAAKDAGIYNDTNFVILGDHGFLDVDYKITLNVAFRKAGLINVDSNGKVTDWKAYANYCDGSVQIALKDKEDIEVKNKVVKILNDLKNDADSGIDAIYTKEEASKKHVVGNFEFMLEAKKGYYFENGWTGDNVITKIEKSNSKVDEDDYFVATHGFDPLKEGYRTFFMAGGPGIKKGVIIPSINMVDEGPTMASMLGLKLNNADGKVLKEILEE